MAATYVDLWDRLPKRAIAVVQATVIHILSSVPVIPKYGFPLPTADLTGESELSMDGEVVRGGNGETKNHHSKSISNGSCGSNLVY
jgi:hypothetical protein